MQTILLCILYVDDIKTLKNVMYISTYKYQNIQLNILKNFST